MIKSDRTIIALILIAALAVRFTAALPFGQLHSDEVGQYLEQAHRLIFGYGIVPWEYREGMRSWLVPLVLSPFMALGHAIAPDSTAYILLPRFFVALCSLSILWAGWRLGRAVSPVHGWVTMIVAAFWYEFVLMGAHTITEPLATAAILPAAALLLAGDATRKQLILAGALLTLGCVLRFHYGPAVVLIALAALWGRWSRLMPMIIGALATCAVSAAVDLWAGQIPFSWIFINVRFNIVHDVASRFGVAPPLAYLAEFRKGWGWAYILTFLAILPAIRHYRILFWAAVLNLILHSLIAHKEYRFLFLTTSIFLFLAAIGSVEIMRWAKDRYFAKSGSWVLNAPLGFWLLASVTLGSTLPRVNGWTQYGASMALTYRAGQLPATCGFAFEHGEFWTSGALSTFHKNAPFYLQRGLDPAKYRAGQPLEASAGFNTVVGPETLKSLLPKTYSVLECRPVGLEAETIAYKGSPNICLFQRPGPCDGGGLDEWQAQRVLERVGL